MILDIAIFLVAGWCLYACAKWVVTNKQKNQRKDDRKMRDELSRRRNDRGE